MTLKQKIRDKKAVFIFIGKVLFCFSMVMILLYLYSYSQTGAAHFIYNEF